MKMRVNYGSQQAYRLHGTEPACASCVHFGAERAPRGEVEGSRYCAEKQRYVAPGDICTSYEREAGAD